VTASPVLKIPEVNVLNIKQISFIVGLSIATLSQADEAAYTKQAPTIDGIKSEAVWQEGIWYKIDQHILGDFPSKEDFSGQYTLRWDKDFLYLLAEIQDDTLFDTHPDPKQNYWDDDCFEIFIDEDRSGGNHLENDNAFAYHIALDNQVVDIGPPKSDGTTNVRILNDHIQSAWQRSKTAPFHITWELAIRIYDDSYTDSPHDKPVTLKKDKKLGFMVAYCDNDGSSEREHFVGSHKIKPVNGDKNLGYIDASVFDELVLKKP
jgi:hypothetical protein